MSLLEDTPTAAPATPTGTRPSGLTVRLWLTGRAALVTATALIGFALFPLWITLVALSPLALVAPLVIPATSLVRAYADAHRRAAVTVVGAPIPAPYREARPGVLPRVLGILRDPASWRDAGWLLAHAVAGFVTALLTVVLFLAGVFYLVYPLLYAVTPQNAFGHPFGDWAELHSVGAAFVMTPLSLVAFGLWFVLVLPLTRAGAAIDRSLLGPR